VPTRLIIDAPLAGPANMARDEALLQNCIAPECDVVLRFYAWQPATISLGYFQSFDDFASQPSHISAMPVVRRTTGGGAILHDAEVTYSITMPLNHPLIAGNPNELYKLAHRAIIAAIGCKTIMLQSTGCTCDASSQRGPFFCFARRHDFDVVVPNTGGFDKIAGSAQRRTRTAVLQHGSIILDRRIKDQPAAAWSSLRGRDIEFDDAVRLLVPAFADQLGAVLKQTEWTPDILDASKRFEPTYAGDPWTRSRERSA
jgi:lipoate-protein ligase A